MESKSQTPKTAKTTSKNVFKRDRRRKELTESEARFFEARLNGQTLEQSCVAAGLAPYKQTGYNVEQRIREKAPEIFNAAGVTVDRIAKKVSELLDKKKTLYYTNVVLDSKEVDDTAAQVKATDFALRVHGLTGGLKDGNDGEGNKSNGPTLSVVFTDEGRARQFVEAIAARRAASGLPVLDARVDPNLG